jgi:hypothetical protein
LGRSWPRSRSKASRVSAVPVMDVFMQPPNE